MKRRYLDYNATTPLGAAAKAVLTPLFADPLGAAAMGNPSSLHESGRKARHLVESARKQVAALVGGDAFGVTFTGSGTEAIALGAVGLARRARAADSRRTRILVGASEHSAVLGAAASLVELGFTVENLAVDDAGRVLTDEAVARIDDEVALLLVQLANHETGVLQPVAELARAARACGAYILCDVVQAAGKVAVDLTELAVDAVCLSAHKLYAMKGVGALVLREGVDVDPLVVGGHQERGRRGGTEAVWGIAAFGAAADEAGRQPFASSVLRDRLESGLVAAGARIFGRQHARVPNTTMFAFPGVSGHLLTIALDLEGYEVSTGAACSSGSVRPSAVLLAAGHPAELASCAVRVSLGRGTNDEDIDGLLGALPSIVARVALAARA